MQHSLYYFCLFLILSMHSCVTSPDFPSIPNIEFQSFSKSTLVQGSVNNDSTFLTFTFEDGDGDIGFDISNNEPNLFLIDNRTGDSFDKFKIPLIPEEGIGNGVSGKIKILLLTTCCVFPDNIPPCESPDLYPSNDLTFDMYIVDRAGNSSNTITTPPLKLLCN